MDLPVPPAEIVLAQPTRAQLFALLGEIKRPAGTVELAERLGRHPNGVRLHLERMHDAGLLTRTRVAQRVGRPRDAWTIAADARPGGEPPTGYAELGRWLTRAVPAGQSLRQVEVAGRQIGREIAPRASPATPEETMHAALAAMGFQPRRQPAGPGCVSYVLGNCPYRAAVRASPELICTLHRGVTRGLLDVLDPSARLVAFVRRDPYVAGCIVTLDALSDAPSSGDSPA